MKRKLLIVGAVALLGTAAVAVAANNRFQVNPHDFDPAHTFLVESSWIDGIGCPTNAATSADGVHQNGPAYTDPACATGDTSDNHNQGLLLDKTGPTANYASATADIKDVKGPITELGYDIRKPGADVNDPRGSHCGAGAPRFNVTLANGASYFIGCNSPAPTTDTAGTGFQRLRWGGSSALMGYNTTSGALEAIPNNVNVKSIQIVFDEGQDTGPDNFGLAVLDNVDVNGVLVGQGPGRQNCDDSHGKDRGDCRDNSHDQDSGRH